MKMHVQNVEKSLKLKQKIWCLAEQINSWDHEITKKL